MALNSKNESPGALLDLTAAIANPKQRAPPPPPPITWTPLVPFPDPILFIR